MGTAGTAHFRLAWTPAVEDWAEGFAAYRRSPRGRRTQGIGVGIALGCCAVALWLRIPTLLVVPFVLVVVVLGTSSRRLAKRAMRRYPGLQAPTRADVTPSGLTITIGSETVPREWSSISAVAEGERTFVLFIGPLGGRAFTLLAKRGLTDPSQLPQLRALLQEQIARSPASSGS